MDVNDIVRNLTVSLGGLGIGLIITIVIYYAKKTVHEDKAARRLLPLHVTTIGVAYLLLSLAAARDVHTRFNEPLGLPVLFALPAFVIGDIALFIVLKHIHYRKIGEPDLIREEDTDE